MTIGARLKEERDRIGLSQPNFAALAGTTKQTLFSWESGKTAPDGFQLAALANAKVDVLYVLTGQRQEALPAGDPSEQLLLDNYRRCTQDAKQTLLKSSVLFAAGMGEPQSTPSGGAIKASVKNSLFGLAMNRTGKK